MAETCITRRSTGHQKLSAFGSLRWRSGAGYLSVIRNMNIGENLTYRQIMNRKWVALAVFILGIPVFVGFGIYLEDEKNLKYVAAIHAWLFMISLMRMLLAKCPSCGKKFYLSGSMSDSFWISRKYCSHCEMPKSNV